MKFNDLLTGFIRLHILHHAAEQEIYGQWMIDELARHGYRLSPGTMYRCFMRWNATAI
jgi:PadR family transcriptional regulator, regulatory protein PadR